MTAPAKRRARLLKKYGMDERRWNALMLYQGGRCALCGKPPKSRLLALDHDHQSKRKPSRLHGRLRGACCSRCNRFIIASNNAQTARMLVEYLSSDFDARNL